MKKEIKQKGEELQAQYGSPDRPIKIGEDVELQCYVLNDKKRVLVQRGLTKSLGMSTGGGTGGAQRIVQFIDSKSISPFISNELRLRIENPIKFTLPDTGIVANGYEATILVDICDAIIESRNKGELHKQQYHIAERAEMLIRALAKTGIIALVDEVTGYQKIREKDALQQFLDKFLLEEKAKWVKTFPDEFFEMIFRMKGWTWHYASTRKPGVVGHYINDFVYSRLGPKVLSELQERNPKNEKGHRKGKHTEWINSEYGHPKLKEHLNILIAFGKASGFNWNGWKRMVERALPQYNSDGSTPLEIEFKEVD